MTIFLSQSDLTKGGLKLLLSNDLGQFQDAASVKWTIFSMSSGAIVSGEHVQAVKADTGHYYATWRSDVPSGSYKILWEINSDDISEPQQLFQPFYVVDPSDYKCHRNIVIRNHPPAVGSLVFLPFSFLGPNDLFIVLRDENGFAQDAYSILWQIQTIKGRQIIPRTPAVRISAGVYYAPWTVMVCTGDYRIVWEFQQDSDSPLQQSSQSFSVIGHSPFFKIVPGSVCGSQFIIQEDCQFYIPYGDSCVSMPHNPCGCGDSHSRFFIQPCSPIVPVAFAAPQISCCDYEISRQVHLITTVLPLGGVFTNQAAFSIPTRIREIAFYITYTRGAPNGFATFRLLWGNGTEEIQETVRDLDIIPEDSAHVAQNLFVQDLYGPTPADNNPINFVLSVAVPGGVTRVRLIAAEGGVPGSPGTIGITLTAST